MATIPQIRGALLEEIVLYLLEKVGYRIIEPGEEGTDPVGSGLKVRGRGEWHQIDALAAFDKTPTFMYPLRLMIEAKCYQGGKKVGIEVVRNAVGVLKDISENYFTHRDLPTGQEVQIPRFNYHGAIFSNTGYTKGTQRYAIAHQIFLIQYYNVGLIKPILDKLLLLRLDYFLPLPKLTPNLVRDEFRRYLKQEDLNNFEVFNEKGKIFFREEIIHPLKSIKGSYFGMLNGKWPLHLLSKNELPEMIFKSKDTINCRVYGRQSNIWSFEPIEFKKGEKNWFRLEFDLPDEIAVILDKNRRDALYLAQLKEKHMNYLDVSGKIGGIQRQIRLVLDEDWIQGYIQKMKKKSK